MFAALMSLPRPSVTALGLSAMLLAACGPLGIYYKAGTSVAPMNDTQTTCEVEALGKVPVDQRIVREPVRIVPRQVCNKKGDCTTVYDRIGGEIRTYDANVDLRQRVLNQCMTAKGYTYVELPACSQSIKRAAPAGVTTVMPRLAPNSCAIDNNNGTWQIVTPG